MDEAVNPGHITRAQAITFLEKLKSAKSRLATISQKAEATIDCVKQGAEGVGSAFGFAYANGRWGGTEGVVKIMGAPADLVIGGLGFAAALMGFGGKYDEDLLNLSVGALCVPAVREGYKQGNVAQSKDSQAKANPTMGPGAVNANQYAPGAVNANQYAPGAVNANQYAPGAANADAYAPQRAA